MNNENYLDEVDHFEKLTLARALKFPKVRNELKISSENFRDPRHGAIYEKLINDPNFNAEKLISNSVKDKTLYGDYNFVRSIIMFDVVSEHGSIHDQLQIYDYYKQREISELSKEYLQDPNDENAMKINNRVTELNAFDIHGDSGKLKVLSEIMDDMYNDVKKEQYHTGFKELDNIIDGFEMQQINVIAARSSMGKTAFAIQLGMNLSERENTEVIFCSVETTEKNLTMRLLSSISGVPLRKMKDPHNRMTSDDISRVMLAIDKYYAMPFKIEEKARLTPNMVRSIINNVSDEKNVFIIIDYLQLMKSDSKHNGIREEINDISVQLKGLVQENKNVTIIPLVQVNRGVEQRNDKRPMMSDMKESGQIEQDSNMIIGLYRDDYYNKEEETGDISELEAIVLKNKDGAIGTAITAFFKGIQRIE